MTNVDNGMLDPLPGEQPAEPPATPGTVTVLLTIPLVFQVHDEPDMVACGRLAKNDFRQALCSECVDRLSRGTGFVLNDIETTATFEADQDPGGEG